MGIVNCRNMTNGFRVDKYTFTEIYFYCGVVIQQLVAWRRNTCMTVR